MVKIIKQKKKKKKKERKKIGIHNRNEHTVSAKHVSL
jgi:hypothetical protein